MHAYWAVGSFSNLIYTKAKTVHQIHESFNSLNFAPLHYQWFETQTLNYHYSFSQKSKWPLHQKENKEQSCCLSKMRTLLINLKDPLQMVLHLIPKCDPQASNLFSTNVSTRPTLISSPVQFCVPPNKWKTPLVIYYTKQVSSNPRG